MLHELKCDLTLGVLQEVLANLQLFKCCWHLKVEALTIVIYKSVVK